MFRWIKGNDTSALADLSPPLDVADVTSDLPNVVGHTYELTLTELTAEDGGIYSCVAINGAGYDTVSVTLYISPEIITEPQDGLVEVGSPHNLTCLAMSYPDPTYQWEKYNQTTDQYEEIPGESYSELIFESFTEGDYGIYRCRVTTPTINEVVYSSGATITGMSVFVVSDGSPFDFIGLLIADLSPDARVIVLDYGNSITINCTIVTDINVTVHALEYFWTYDDEILPDETTAMLSIGYLSLESAYRGGLYQCYVATADATVTAASPNVVVAFAPVILVEPMSTGTLYNSSVRLNCSAVGYPTPHVELYRVSSSNVSTLLDVMSSSVELPYSADIDTYTTNTTEQSILTISSVDHDDYGYYICVATFPSDSFTFVYDCCNGNNTESIDNDSFDNSDISNIATLTGL